VTRPGYGDCCPACGSDEVIPYAVIIGGSEEYGYQCGACAVMWPVLAHAAAANAPAIPDGNTAA
jgi:uncharacterized Zn finger protein